MSVPFTIILPGQAPITNFQCDNGIYHTDIVNPHTVANVCLTLTCEMPCNMALALYYSQPPYTELQYLGAVSNARPSDIFSTGFPLRPEISGLPTVKLCLRPQTFDEIKELVVASDGKKEYTKLVAQNLYNYMMSYNKSGLLVNGVEGEYLVIPANFLDKWLEKFEAKYARDPNFMLKTTSN